MNLHFVCKKFFHLCNQELYNLLRLRAQVFVVEQNCVYQDLDTKDLYAHHLLMYDNETLVAYARLIPQNISYSEISIGRVVNAKDYRGKGVGKILMNKAIEECYKVYGKQPILISAQVYAIGFYEQFGFEKTGNQYIEDDIPHIKMILK